jgi:alginate O-acetyltransferase complex protein AlgI
MLFNSIDFFIFLPLVFCIYWSIRNLRAQNLFVVLASYFFYGWWDWRFLLLIFLSTAVDYSVGLRLLSTQSPRKRKSLLRLSILVNLGALGVFKYYNFFADNFVAAFSFFGYEISPSSLNIILPVGISFYTFQTLSYTIDIYRKQLHPTRDFIAFSAFVSFFPQLVAGPIERAAHLLPQFYSRRNFDCVSASDGMRQILWGLFKKVVIADSCALLVNDIFSRSGELAGSTLLLGAVLFAFQIYGDFSGYSDIAIGTARLFGFDLMRNFAFPYFSRDIAEFWRRWHISLSTWFRDYLYVPLGGSKGSTSMRIRNTFVIFIVSGFWHGANWTFIIWGLLNALFFLPLLLASKNRTHLGTVAQGRRLPSWKEACAMLCTFGLTCLAWIFFRSESLGHAFTYLRTIFSKSLFSAAEVEMDKLGWYLFLFVMLEWTGREQQYAIETLGVRWKRPYRWALYIVFLFMITSWGGDQNQTFIYFQF